MIARRATRCQRFPGPGGAASRPQSAKAPPCSPRPGAAPGGAGGVREKRGLAYAVSSDLNILADTGLLEIHAAVDPGRVDELLSVVRGECAALAAGGVTRDELRHVREHLRGLLLLGAESTENRMVRLAKNHMLFGRHIPLSETAAKVAAIPLDAVNEAARSLLNPARAVVGVLGQHIEPSWLEGAPS